MIVVVVVILCVVAVAAIASTVVGRQHLTTQREVADRQAEQLAAAQAALAQSERERAAGEARASDAENQARVAAEEAERVRLIAEERAVAAEQQIAEAAARRAAVEAAASEPVGVDGKVDPQVLWAMERSRSERTWRHSVALGPDSTSVFVDTANALVEALRVEADATRETVGAVIDVDVALPDGLTAAGSVLILRSAQELLADVAKRAEATVLRVHADGVDVLVIVDSVDAYGGRIEPFPLRLPLSDVIEQVDGGVRVRGAVGVAAAAVAGDEQAPDPADHDVVEQATSADAQR
jgi:multidrug efflux pump subunit AcrA (membrane-fusion protein)